LNYLLDTNVLSELRKGQRADRGVRQWFSGCEDERLFTSVLCLGEIRMGIEAVKPRNALFAARLQLWLDHTIENFEERIIAVDQAIALGWGLGSAPVSRAPIDELLAATAKIHGMTLVTRNVKEIEHTGVSYLDPFLATH
jgi:predicted nucleic acid-binding protein